MAGGSMPQRNYFCGNGSSAKFDSWPGIQRKEAKTQSFDANFTNWREFKCAEGATEISPVLTRSGYAGKSSHKNIFPRPSDGRGIKGEGKASQTGVRC
jgi:hypothetical protein